MGLSIIYYPGRINRLDPIGFYAACCDVGWLSAADSLT